MTAFHLKISPGDVAAYVLLPGDPGRASYNGYWQSWWGEHFNDLARLIVAAAEMEASVILVLARVWGLRAGGMAVVLDNVRRVSETSGEFVPEKQIEHGPEHIERLARLGCETVRHLAMHDKEAARKPASLDAGELAAGSAGVEKP